MRFRIRSAKRDEQTDAGRLGSIERSILDCINGALAEKKGLEKRARDASNLAAMAMGTDVYEFEGREPETERQLSASEATMSAVRGRTRQIDTHIAHLHQLLELVRKTQ
jgi:hypothetical protein